MEAAVPPGSGAGSGGAGLVGWDRRRGWGDAGGASKPPDFMRRKVLGKALLSVDETGCYFWAWPRERLH